MESPVEPSAFWYVLSRWGEFLVLLGAIIIAVVGWMAWQADNKIAEFREAGNERRHKETEIAQREISSNLADAARRLLTAESVAAEAQEKAENARQSYVETLERAAKAEKDAAEALKSQAEILDRAATAEREAALAIDRASNAQARALQIEAENLKLQRQVSPRRIASDTKKRLAVSWKEFSGKTVALRSYSLDAEGAVLASQILDVLMASGIKVVDSRMSEMPMGALSVGILVYGTDDALVQRLGTTLARVEGLAVAPLGLKPTPGTGLFMGNAAFVHDEDASILIGVKPPN